MKTKIHIVIACSTVLAAALIGFAFTSKQQQWILTKSVTTAPIHKVSLDRYYNLYTADDRGNLFRFDTSGNELLKYSPIKKADITLIEAWRSVNTFLFFRELQEYTLLDRFLNNNNTNYKFKQNIERDEREIGFARLATIANDNNLWVFDDEDFSLKKFDTKYNKVIINTPLELILDPSYYDLTFMREYQNLLFINDKNSGILIFDNLGNYKSKLEYQGIEYFSFSDNNIYFLAENKLQLIDIYTGIQKTIELPERKIYRFILLTPSHAYLVHKNGFDIFSITID